MPAHSTSFFDPDEGGDVLSAMSPVATLREQLELLGAVVGRSDSDGAFSWECFTLDGLRIELTSEYGRWLANVGLGDGPLSPAAYWLAALAGDLEVPDVGPNDLTRLSGALPELLAHASLLEPAVESLRAKYRAVVKARLS